MPYVFTPVFQLPLRLALLVGLTVASLLTASPVSAQPRTAKVPANGRKTAFIPKNPPVSAFDGLQTIQNSQVKIGVDSRYGGAITYLSTPAGANMVNNVDLGRQIQVGLYGGPVPYSEAGKTPHPTWAGLGWNPIQAGDVFGNASNVLAFRKEDNLLYVKTQPRHFAMNDVLGESYIEHWIRLDGNVVKVHAKVTMFRSNKTQFEARQQEFPCVYLNGAYHNMYAYTGNSPYTYDGLQQVRPPTDFGDIYPTEPWMASTDDNGFGVGLFMENCYSFKKGYFGADLSGDEFSNDASYIAVTPFVLFDPDGSYEWDYEMVVGHLTDIRAHMYAKPRPATGPDFRFTTSRQGWHYFNATDEGMPTADRRLHINLRNKTRDLIQSPLFFWRGADNPKLYLRAAFQTQHNQFRLTWRRASEVTLYRDEGRYVDFPIINDGQFHTYEIDLSQQSGWTSANVTQLELRPPPNGPDVNGWVELEWLTGVPRTPDIIPPPKPNPPVPVNLCVSNCVPIRIQKVR